MFVHVKFFSKMLNYIFFQGKKKNPGLFSGASIGFPEQSMAEWGAGIVQGQSCHSYLRARLLQKRSPSTGTEQPDPGGDNAGTERVTAGETQLRLGGDSRHGDKTLWETPGRDTHTPAIQQKGRKPTKAGYGEGE